MDPNKSQLAAIDLGFLIRELRHCLLLVIERPSSPVGWIPDVLYSKYFLLYDFEKPGSRV